MREIIFRGFDGIDWIYGSAVQYDKETDTWYMIENGAPDDDWVMVGDIGQYTGLFDDNGKMIYEGDIVKVFDGKREHISDVKIHPLGVYINAHPVIEQLTGKGIELLYNYSDYGNGRGITQRCYVLGNIHDNPELLTSK